MTLVNGARAAPGPVGPVHLDQAVPVDQVALVDQVVPAVLADPVVPVVPLTRVAIKVNQVAAARTRAVAAAAVHLHQGRANKR